MLVTPSGGVHRSFTARLPSPLLGRERRHQPELVRALGIFLDCAGSRHAHVNTVGYQVRRVEQLAGRSLSSMADRVDFFLRPRDTGAPR
ncbi:helix-turn-helix domain-containing protein [Nonomuraea angiospora]|uniref:helix-turn-helix domain-containing protein n=1 Tax=Nonomuraea angiospora TaxID=46172 RepID=UPI0033F6F6A8